MHACGKFLFVCLLFVFHSPCRFHMATNSCKTTLQRNELILINGSIATFSFLCCVVAVSMVIVLRLYIHFIYRLAMYQVLASLFFSMSIGLALMLYDYKEDHLYYTVSCKMTAFLLVYSPWVKILFTSWLTFHLFSYVVFFKNLKRLEWLYISSSVFGPLLIACIPLVHNDYGFVGPWCYIRSWNDDCATEKYTEGIIEQFVLFYGPAFLMVGLCVVAIVTMLSVLLYRNYSRVIYDDQSHAPLLDRDQRKEVIKQLLPLLAYPIIYLLILIFPLTYRIYSAISPDTDFVSLLFLGLSYDSVGFFSSMALLVHLCSVQRYKRWKRSEDTTSVNARTLDTSKDCTSYYKHTTQAV